MLNKIKDGAVFIDTGSEDSVLGRIDDSKVFIMTAMAMSLGAKKVFNAKDQDIEGQIVIRYYNSKNPDVSQKSGLTFDVYWCSLNKALTLEKIWKDGELVGWMKYEGNSGEPKGELLENYAFFDTKFTNYDFTMGLEKSK